jgi:hypothetical protein
MCTAEYQDLGSEPQGRHEEWRRFLLTDDPREKAVQRGDWVIGDDAFRLRVSQARGRPIPRGRGRLRRLVTPDRCELVRKDNSRND